jgi:hypothetical protein
MESNTRNKGDRFHGVPRNQLPIACFDMCQGFEAVDLQFKDKLVGVERLKTAGKPYRTHPAWKHALKYKAGACFVSGFCQVDQITSPDFSIFQYVTRW